MLTAKGRAPHILPGTLIVLLAFVPLIRLAWYVLTHTVNCLGNDYDFMVPAAIDLLDPTRSLIDRLRSCCFGPHCFLQQVAIHALVAQTSHWDSTVEVSLGLFLALLRIPLMLGALSPHRSGGERLALFAAVMAFTFGSTNTSTFIYGQPSISTAVVLWWIAVASFCAVRYKGQWHHTAGYLVAALVSGLTGAYLVAVVTLSGIIGSLTSKKRGQYLLTLAGLVSGAATHLLVRSLSTVVSGGDELALRPVHFIQILGRPFYASLGIDATVNAYCAAVGFAGLMLLPLLLYLHKVIKTEQRQLAGAYCYIGAGLAMALMISLSRASIAPWYAPFASLYWLGLMALALHLVFSKAIALAAKIAASLVLIVTLTFYLFSNLSFKDKDHYQRTHGPVSASILRHYQMAPTYGESYVTAAHIGEPTYQQKIAVQLERHNWSTFAPDQSIYLQGDFILPTVTLKPPNNYQWVDDTGKKARDWRLSDQLDLVLPAKTELDWQVTLPPDTITATLTTTAHPAALDSREPVKVQIRLSDRALAVFDFMTRTKTGVPIAVDLSPYKGQTITLRLITPQTTEVNFYRPQIKLTKSDNTAMQTHKTITPCNTELSPYWDHGKYNEIDLPFTEANWLSAGIERDRSIQDGFKFTESGARLTCAGKLDLSSDKLKDLVFSIASDTSLVYQCCALQFTTDRDRVVTELVPILKDGQMHQYSLPTRCTSLEKGEKIVGLVFFPYFLQDHARFRLQDLKLRMYP